MEWTATARTGDDVIESKREKKKSKAEIYIDC